MRHIYFFGHYMNGLEYVTYVLIPVAMILVILVFVYFNAKVVRLSFLEEYEEMKDIYDKIEEDIDDIDNLLENNKVMKKIKSNISVHTMVNTLYDKGKEIPNEPEEILDNLKKEVKK